MSDQGMTGTDGAQEATPYQAAVQQAAAQEAGTQEAAAQKAAAPTADTSVIKAEEDQDEDSHYMGFVPNKRGASEEAKR
ncbi:hypothetical protein PG997_005504 [Apiospora hydei]|uniref:Uncharacterized protein n=1 Tax=Apiospora hydei TaxID=1337664 RepID=A0ABR1WLA7_9PEZI